MFSTHECICEIKHSYANFTTYTLDLSYTSNANGHFLLKYKRRQHILQI